MVKIKLTLTFEIKKPDLVNSGGGSVDPSALLTFAKFLFPARQLFVASLTGGDSKLACKTLCLLHKISKGNLSDFNAYFEPVTKFSGDFISSDKDMSLLVHIHCLKCPTYGTSYYYYIWIMSSQQYYITIRTLTRTVLFLSKTTLVLFNFQSPKTENIFLTISSSVINFLSWLKYQSILNTIDKVVYQIQEHSKHDKKRNDELQYVADFVS